jgi:hypothetical protein
MNHCNVRFWREADILELNPLVIPAMAAGVPDRMWSLGKLVEQAS